MKRVTATLGAMALTAGAATAGGIDRSGQSVGVIFESGNYAEFSIGHITPNVKGTATAPYGGFASGDMAVDYSQIGGAIKFNLGKSLDAAVIFDQPFGADVNYPAAPFYYMRGSTADLNTSAITGVLKYRFPSNVSIFGGLRYESMDAKASVTVIPGGGYLVNGARDSSLGYLVGVAFEKPEIALRVALTYNSKIRHTLDTTETVPLLGLTGAASITTINSPQSVNLEFQTGVAKDTLVFGSVRWVDWSAYVIDPANYPPANPLVSYAKDTVTYSLGIGRKLNDNWSIAASVGFEKPTGGFTSNLGPTDGKRSITLGASYTRDKMKITGGITYVDIGNAHTTLDGATTAANFTGNTAIGVGIKVGFSF